MATIQKINGIKQTWHTIEFSNNHTNPTTTPHSEATIRQCKQTIHKTS